MSFFAAHLDPESFIITPALVVTVGRCECCQKAGAVRLALSWLVWEIGIDFAFSTHD